MPLSPGEVPLAQIPSLDLSDLRRKVTDRESARAPTAPRPDSASSCDENSPAARSMALDEAEILNSIPSLANYSTSDTENIQLRKGARRTKKRRSCSFNKTLLTNDELKPIMYDCHIHE